MYASNVQNLETTIFFLNNIFQGVSFIEQLKFTNL